MKKLCNLSIPGSEIPDWFTQDLVSFSKRKNFAIEGVVIAVIVSVNREERDDLRGQMPVIPDIKATILRLKKPVYTTEMYLAGVPETDENQLYLCRYEHYHSLVSMLKDGDEIKVIMRNPPIVKGVNLKKYGIHLVFENDDDYCGDEDSLDENQQSVSERISRFIGGTDENGNECFTARDSNDEDGEEQQHNIFSFFRRMFENFKAVLFKVVFWSRNMAGENRN